MITMNRIVIISTSFGTLLHLGVERAGPVFDIVAEILQKFSAGHRARRAGGSSGDPFGCRSVQ
ncbi:hypothetical protein [Cryptosporangium sp. NPDC051539]|uniref:hypothetical protein n=1 Tax=Cryptosporangium sp. NPDC051539 TaxID=3363962 RepID=UPI003794CCA9